MAIQHLFQIVDVSNPREPDPLKKCYVAREQAVAEIERRLKEGDDGPNVRYTIQEIWVMVRG